jgi:hypothetical protein
VDDLVPHKHFIKSAGVGPVHATDVDVRDPACDNGIGKVEVEVVDSGDLSVTLYCLVDQSRPTMTLPGVGTDAARPSSPH